jgi:hypothetical protein
MEKKKGNTQEERYLRSCRPVSADVCMCVGVTRAAEEREREREREQTESERKMHIYEREEEGHLTCSTEFVLHHYQMEK